MATSRHKRIQFTGLGVAALLFSLGYSANAQQQKKIPRLGYLTANPGSVESARLGAFRRGLHELGYLEGKNITVVYRYAQGRSERLPMLAAELVQLPVDIIVSAGTSPTHFAKEATATIPIIMTNDGDPVGSGFIASLARPGGNITGLANFNSELSGKRLELLKEIIPKLTRVAAFGTSSNLGNTEALRETETAAVALGVKIQYLDIVSPKQIEGAFRAATDGRVHALLVLRELWSILFDHASWSSRQKAGCQRCIRTASGWKTAV